MSTTRRGSIVPIATIVAIVAIVNPCLSEGRREGSGVGASESDRRPVPRAP